MPILRTVWDDEEQGHYFSGARESGILGRENITGRRPTWTATNPWVRSDLISKLNHPPQSSLSTASVQWGSRPSQGRHFQLLHAFVIIGLPAWPLSFGYTQNSAPIWALSPDRGPSLHAKWMNLPIPSFTLWNTVSAISIKHNGIVSFSLVTTENGS